MSSGLNEIYFAKIYRLVDQTVKAIFCQQDHFLNFKKHIKSQLFPIIELVTTLINTPSHSIDIEPIVTTKMQCLCFSWSKLYKGKVINFLRDNSAGDNLAYLQFGSQLPTNNVGHYGSKWLPNWSSIGLVCQLQKCQTLRMHQLCCKFITSSPLLIVECTSYFHIEGTRTI